MQIATPVLPRGRRRDDGSEAMSLSVGTLRGTGPREVSPSCDLPEDLKLLDAEGVAAALGIHKRSVFRHVSTGLLPQPDVRIGTKTARWRVSTVRTAVARFSGDAS